VHNAGTGAKSDPRSQERLLNDVLGSMGPAKAGGRAHQSGPVSLGQDRKGGWLALTDQGAEPRVGLCTEKPR